MTMTGPGDDLLRRLEGGADGGSELCLQEVVLQQRVRGQKGKRVAVRRLKRRTGLAHMKWFERSEIVFLKSSESRECHSLHI